MLNKITLTKIKIENMIKIHKMKNEISLKTIIYQILN